MRTIITVTLTATDNHYMQRCAAGALARKTVISPGTLALSPQNKHKRKKLQESDAGTALTGPADSGARYPYPGAGQR